MTEVFPWVERRFEGRPSVDLHPNVRARLAGVAARVEEVTRGLPRELLVERVERKWSIQEHAGHLLDLEPLFGQRMQEYQQGVETLSAADMSNAVTERARHNEGELRAIVEALRAARAEMLDLLDGLDAEAFGRIALHPRLQQPMRLLDLALFVAEHDDHHLAKMRELRRRLS